MEDLINQLNDIQFFGIDVVTLGLWIIVGVLAGSLLPGRRPLGLLGSMIGGVLGGLGAGYVIKQYPSLNPAQYISGVDPTIQGWIGAFIAALVGAIVVLLLLRIIFRG